MSFYNCIIVFWCSLIFTIMNIKVALTQEYFHIKTVYVRTYFECVLPYRLHWNDENATKHRHTYFPLCKGRNMNITENVRPMSCEKRWLYLPIFCYCSLGIWSLYTRSIFVFCSIFFTNVFTWGAFASTTHNLCTFENSFMSRNVGTLWSCMNTQNFNRKLSISQLLVNYTLTHHTSDTYVVR